MKGKEEINSSVGFEPWNEELPFEVDVKVCLCFLWSYEF